MKLFKSLLLTASLLAAWPLAAQTAGSFPAKPIKILVPFNAGSGADSSSRFYGEQLGKLYNQTVTVENKPGGNGFIAIDTFKRGATDSTDLTVAGNYVDVTTAAVTGARPRA